MASRQKSFFDQKSNARPAWRSAWKPGITSRGIEPPPKPVTAMAPIPASSQSRSKLKAFQYGQGAEKPSVRQNVLEEQEANKENTTPESNKTAAPPMNPPPQPLSQKSSMNDSRECPQTPIGRLPLSELLASGDDAHHHLNVTPIERVLWDNSPLDSEPTNSLSARKGRKRAHSSSPASSSQNETSKHFASGNPTVDLQALQKALKTPKADPADDLWSRYSLNTVDRRTPPGPDGLLYAHLLHSSSPQTPAARLQIKESGGLRRALSCIEWPTSAAKRRKMHHGSSQREGMPIFAANDRPLISIEQSKMSRVSLLVEKMHDGLTKPVQRPEYSSSEPSKSSPVASRTESPNRDSALSQQSESGVASVVQILSQAAMADRQPRPQPLVLSAEEVANLEAAEGSSDFGDDVLDLEMIEAVNAHVEGRLKRTSSTPTAAKTLRQSGRDMYSQRSGSSNPPHPISTTMPQNPGLHDEFDDDEVDVSAADLEDVFAQYDHQQTSHDGNDIVHRPMQKNVGKVQLDPATKTVSNDKREAKERASSVMVEIMSDDDFGGDSDFEDIVAEYAEVSQTEEAKSKSQSQSCHNRKPPILQRYIIQAVAEGEYDTSTAHRQMEKVLSVQNEKTKLSKAIILRQAWFDSPCSPGSYIHLIGEFDRYGQCVVDNAQNLVVLHPDHLISSTVVGDSFTCTRKAVLQDRVKTASDANQATIYGHMLHEIFQEAMRANRWDDAFMTSTIESMATRYLETLFEINVELDLAIDQLKARVVDLQAWAEIFVAAKPKPNAIVKDRNGAQAVMCVNKLLEVEEKVWSPMYGLKGNVDATVQVVLSDGDGEKTLTVPFELKTGKHSSAAHKAQTSLYTLLLSDRYDVDIACGILYYMQTSEISSIRTIRHELVPMILQRNELASYVRHRTQLPAMLKKPYTCGKCYAQTPCFLYHKLVDNGNGETSGMGEKFEDLVRHLKPEHQTFFSKWDDLLTKEEKDIMKFRRELWTMLSSEREKAGRCFGGVVIDAGSFHEETDAPKINRFSYNFVKQKPVPSFSFTESQIALGEPVVISDEKGHFALANGYVTAVRKHKIQVTIDRRLHNARTKGKKFDNQRNQVFTGIMEVVEDGTSQSTITPSQPEEAVVYRIDKDEFSNGMALVRNNLIRLMEKDVFGVQALRRLIVEGVAPTFKPSASEYTLADTASQANLNVDQKAAIEKVMSAKDYALVLGMPGTGKTTTIAHIIRALVAQGKNVLLTSYTHTAVDNILLKLRNDDVGIFRLGAVAKVHPEVQEFADLAGRPMKTVEDLKRCYTRQVVATTCLGINHPIFNQRVFDYCIVDEASQITLPVCLGPIRMARTFILVGDHYQLPPLVQNKEALEGGLDISLFKMLSEKHPSSVVNLEHQYRMCEDIMTLSNTLIYDGRLKCGTKAVATRTITIPNIAALKHHHHNSLTIFSADSKKICTNPSPGTCWLRDLLDPSVQACFVNTDPLIPFSREVLENGSRIINPCEATLTAQLVESLITTGIAPTDIGVITLYRSQLAVIKRSLRHRPGVEMHTADKFQGRDKEVVVLSLVRSNESQIVGDLLKDWRRVNVALTRARTKFLAIGSMSTLVGNELIKQFLTMMEQKNWLFNLPGGALEGHVFEDGGTQLSSGKGSGDSQINTVKDDEKRRAVAARRGLQQGREKRNVPAKQGKLDMKALMGKRPVLNDIINDAS